MTYIINKKFENYSSFCNSIKELKDIYSLSRGIQYILISFVNDEIKGIRKSTNEEFSIDSKALYAAYKNLSEVNTVILKKYIFNRSQSPALAILKALKVI